MRLRNKRTGDAVYVDCQIPLCNNNEVIGCYSVTSLKELNQSFEDYKPNDTEYIRFALTPEQKDKILHTLDSGSYDPYEWIPTVNFILSVLGYDDKIEHDDFDNPRWSNQ